MRVLHVDVYALMVCTYELYIVRRKNYTVPAAGDLISGNRASVRPCTYPPGKLATYPSDHKVLHILGACEANAARADTMVGHFGDVWRHDALTRSPPCSLYLSAR